jgi:hypothetical protein
MHAGDSTRKADTLPVEVVARRQVDGRAYISFDTAAGRRVEVREPAGDDDVDADELRYYPDDPAHVIVVEDNFGRDITLAIVAIKLVVGGPVLTVVGARRLRRP